MNVALWILNHPYTREQNRDAKKKFGIETILTMPDTVGRLWSSIPADLKSSEFEEYFMPLIIWIHEKEMTHGPVIFFISGETTATHWLVSWLGDRAKIYAPTTERVSEEYQDYSGEIVKTNKFKHVTFRKYR